MALQQDPSPLPLPADNTTVERLPFFAQILDSLPDAVCVVDRSGVCVYLNHAATVLFGVERQQMLGQNPWPLGSAAHMALQAARSQDHVRIDLFMPAVERWFELHIGALADVFVATIRDVQDRRDAEALVQTVEQERERTWQREQAARIRAERTAERLVGLQDVTAAFGRALSPERVAEVVVNAGQDLLGAVAVSVVVLHDDGATLELLRSFGYAPDLVEHWHSFPLATPAPLADAMRRKQTIWLASRLERDQRYPHLAAAYPHEHERAWVAVPMVAGERMVGAIGLEWDDTRPFNPEDSKYLHAVAQQASHALERTRLYQETQESLQASEEALARLDRVLNTAPLGMALWDADLRYVHVNQVLASLNDLPAQDHLGRTLPELFPAIAHSLQPLLEHVLQTGEAITNFEIRGRYPHSQREGDWLATFYPVRLGNGQTVGIGAVLLDITEHKRDQASHALSGETTTAFAQTLTVSDVLDVLCGQVAQALGVAGIWVLRLSDDGEWLEVERTQGHSVAIVERYRRVPIHGRSPITEAVRTGERIWLESREEQLAQFPNDAESNGPFGSWAALPLIVNGTPIGAVGLTFSEYRHFDQVQREFIHHIVQQFAQSYERARLYEAERTALALAENAVKIRDQFLSIAAHELKTPLTSLLGNTQLLERNLRRGGQLDERQAHMLDVIVAQSRRMNQMIAALLDVARIQSGQLSIVRTETNLSDLVRRVVAEVQPTLVHHTLVCDMPSENVMLLADELRLEQVLQNLVQNAVKYSPTGGEVRIELAQANDAVSINVSDHGIGIPQEALPRLFERFYRAENADPQRISGMGVGLFVVKEIVELHGGSVSATSVQGEGSRFTVTLPRTR